MEKNVTEAPSGVISLNKNSESGFVHEKKEEKT